MNNRKERFVGRPETDSWFRAVISSRLLLVLWLSCLATPSFAWDYGNGRHGSFVLTTNATIEQLYQTVRLTNDPAQYNPADSNAIPNFQNLTITNGATLTANAWNGSAGGWIVLKVEATLAIASGSMISANGIGYRGGGYLQQGESFIGGQGGSQTANFGGGGGGYGMPNGYYTSAGGGGYATGGGNGGGNPYVTYNGVDYSGVGGGTYGDQTLSTVYFGSGGGGGVVFAPAPYAYPFTGGAGGGCIVINAGNLITSGQIQANGGIPHFEVSMTSVLSSGGGGSGGSIVLRVKTANLGTNQVIASGGSGYNNGGSGGLGRIKVGYFGSYTGITAPGAYSLADTNSDNLTTITSQPAAQTNFWSSNAVVNVGISGYPPFIFQWYFNGAPISGATNQALTFASLNFTNQGSYFVTISNAVMSVTSSNAYLTVLDGRDFDGDGIPNYWEQQYGLNPNNPNDATNHPPGDLLTYFQKYFYGLNPLTLDTDGDGLSDYEELFVYGTNPLKANTTGDGIPDGWKVQNGMNPLVANANDEISSSGISYSQVYQFDLTHTNQLDPRKPFFAPGTSVYEILNGGQHTNRLYYDRDDRLVGEEFSRGISVAYKYDGNGNPIRQAYLSRASETNGLPVLWRFLNNLTNNSSAYADTDGDGWTDFQEWKAGSNPADPQSTPNQIGNPGTNIASLVLPFTPSNFVMGAGQLDGFGAEEIVLGADGNPGTNSNFMLVLTQAAFGWSTQRVDVGSFGITSIGIGQPTNRPTAGIYLGLRGTNGTGQVMEFTKSGGVWQSNVVAVSTNAVANVLGVRSGADLLASLSTNGVDAGLFSLSLSNSVWNQSLTSTNRGQQSIGTHSTVWSRIFRDASVRLVNTNQIEMIAGDREAVKNGLLLPTNWAFNPLTGKYYFQSTNPLTMDDGETFAQQYGTHLVTVGDTIENYWIASQFTKPYWIGLYFVHYGGTIGNFYGAWFSSGQSPNLSYSPSPLWESYSYYNFEVPPPYVYPATDGVCVGLNGNNLWNLKFHSNQYRAVADATGVQTYSNRWLLTPPPYANRIAWKANQIATGKTRILDTNGSSLLTCFVSDTDASGTVSAPDDFIFAEYRTSGDGVTLVAITNIPIGSGVFAQSFGLASVDFLNTGSECVFTAEPSGKMYSWSASSAGTPLQRQLFSGDYTGKAWHALAGVRTATSGQGLAGLMVNPTNQSVCNLIFWQPQVVLPTPQITVVETAPSAAVVPSSYPLGGTAVVTVRLWDNEGNASAPFLQYQILGSTNWQNATLTALDGAAYNPSTRVAALPGGVNHALVWNATADLGPGVATNIMLRARAQDFSLIGNWSQSTPFTVNMTQDSNTNGIPDWWEQKYFSQLVDANADPDHDGMSNYQEYIADTDPTDPNSNLRVTKIQPVTGGMAILWQGGILSTQYLQQRLSLNPTSSWVEIFTNLPPTANPSGFTNYGVTNNAGFYRIRVTR